MKLLLKHRENFFENWYQFDSKLFFIILCLLYFAMFMLKRVFIIDEIAAFEILQERGEMWVYDLFFGLQYLSVPFFLAWKFTITAFLIWVGCFMFGYKIFYRELWRWVMFSELIFLIPEFLKFAWYLGAANDPVYEDIVAFYPLSLINLVDYTSVDHRWHYPLKALNIFEPIYWFTLCIGVLYLGNKRWDISVLIVALSYVVPFLLWLGYYALVYE
ncbi:MAG: hypothetical protein JXQ90_21230 [Cyclobacteriaceae bacterium]